MTTYRADSPAGLREISGVVHDAWFDFDDVRYDSAERTLVVPFAQEWPASLRDDPEWRDAPEPEVVRTTRRFREERVPFMAGMLQIGEAEAVELDPNSGDSGAVNLVRYSGRRRTVVVDCVSGDLQARVSRIDVTAEIVNEVALYVRRRTGLLGACSENPIWETWARR